MSGRPSTSAVPGPAAARSLRWVLGAALLGLPAGSAHAQPPPAFASQAADGTIHIVLRPERAWSSAELVIVGGDTIDLGPAAARESVEIEAWARTGLSHELVLRVAAPDGSGVTWRFPVDTQAVPDRPPFFERGAPREWKNWLFGPKSPEKLEARGSRGGESP